MASCWAATAPLPLTETCVFILSAAPEHFLLNIFPLSLPSDVGMGRSFVQPEAFRAEIFAQIAMAVSQLRLLFLWFFGVWWLVLSPRPRRSYASAPEARGCPHARAPERFGSRVPMHDRDFPLLDLKRKKTMAYFRNCAYSIASCQTPAL